MNQLAPYKAAIAEAKRSFLEVAEASGNLVTYKKEALFAMQAIERSEHLPACSQQSIRDSVINVASIGLSLNPATALAYLVPRGGLCCLDVSYRGLIKLATDSGSIKFAKAEIVHATDVFVYKGMFELPEHEFSPFACAEERGAPIGVYCAAKTIDGDWLVDVMGRESIEKIRATSKSGNSPAWKNFPDEMWKKSITKRAQKYWPKTERLSHAVHVLNQHEGLADEHLSSANQARQYDVRAKSQPIEGEAMVVNEETGEVITEAAAAANAAPLTDGQIRVVKAKLSACGVSEEALFKQFGVDAFNGFGASKINDVLTWVGEASA